MLDSDDLLVFPNEFVLVVYNAVTGVLGFYAELVFEDICGVAKRIFHGVRCGTNVIVRYFKKEVYG